MSALRVSAASAAGMASSPGSSAKHATGRVTVDGKFFRRGRERFWFKGVTYGPFPPDAGGETFPLRPLVERDLALIAELGANGLRLYQMPPPWFLDVASDRGVVLFIDIPWGKHLCFLDKCESRDAARRAVESSVRSCRGHPAVFAFSVANEIPAEIVRWSGVHRMTAFLETLVEAARTVDPDRLYTYTSFPPTEYLQPRNLDFLCCNVFLHQRRAFEQYLARLQTLAGTKPLVLGEIGVDSIREGEAQQAEIVAGQIEAAFRAGLAGVTVFSYTDDWGRGGRPIDDWAFGLTTRDRERKPAFAAAQRVFAEAPAFPRPRWPRVSVVVACYNGQRTLATCLASLSRLHYPDSEVILVDDGSTDETAAIAADFPNVRYVRQEHRGLSMARNTGLGVATGEVIAFTDADCRADDDWLRYLVHDLLASHYAGVGGPNLLPPDDSRVAAAVMASPGGPTHVMLTDREAEHVPGCNMAFFRWALEDVGAFDPVFRTAGDDVDLCWRLQERGHRIGFSPAGFVWHYRRSTTLAYLRQQFGYGEAEALLARKHPEYFNALGGGLWRGRIYAPAQAGVQLRRPVIYHGLFGAGLFQKLYAASPNPWVMIGTTLEYHVVVTLPLLVLTIMWPGLWPVLAVSLGLSLGVCVLAAIQAPLPRGHGACWSRPLVAVLSFLQPIVRGWARYRWRWSLRSVRPTTFRRPLAPEPWRLGRAQRTLNYAATNTVDRYRFLEAILRRLDEEGWQWKSDTGWSKCDAEIFGPRWSRLRLITVAEELEGGQRTLRCRLTPVASLRARVLAGVLTMGVLLVLEAWVARFPWLWLSVLLFALLAWRVEQEKHLVRRLVAAMVDEVAGQLGLRVSGVGATEPTAASPAPRR